MQEAGSKPRYAHSPDTANVQSGPTAGSGRRQAATTAIFLQEACFKHCYIRSRDMSAVVERPERLRAVHLGISAAMARLQEIEPRGSTDSQDDDLAATLERMDLNTTLLEPSSPFFSIVRNSPAANMLNHPAVKFVHGDIDGDVYLENLQRWAKQSVNVIAKGESEIPDDLSQTDLYRKCGYLARWNLCSHDKYLRAVCPTSIDALQGAIGTVCEAVNTVLESSHNETAARRAFVAIRPPGHHCGEDTPSGFCFINNVAIGAAHGGAYHSQTSRANLRLTQNQQRT
jgi:histone deacetylase HOS3